MCAAELPLESICIEALWLSALFNSRLAGFTLRVQPTGVRSYYARFGRNRWCALVEWALCGQTKREKDVRRCWAMRFTAVTL